MSEQTSEALRVAAAGLTYPSESDAAFEPFVWSESGELDEAKVETLTRPKRSRKKRKVEEVPFADFFAELTDSEDAAKFKKLQKILSKLLENLRVFRVGEVNVGIYIVGQDSAGAWAGLHTVSVET